MDTVCAVLEFEFFDDAGGGPVAEGELVLRGFFVGVGAAAEGFGVVRVEGQGGGGVFDGFVVLF